MRQGRGEGEYKLGGTEGGKEGGGEGREQGDGGRGKHSVY